MFLEGRAPLMEGKAQSMEGNECRTSLATGGGLRDVGSEGWRAGGRIGAPMIMVEGLSVLRPATMLPIPGKKMLARRQKRPRPFVPTFGTDMELPARKHCAFAQKPFGVPGKRTHRRVQVVPAQPPPRRFSPEPSPALP